MDMSDPNITGEVRERLCNGCAEIKRRLALLLDAKCKVADEVHAIRKLGKTLRGGFSLLGLAGSSSAEIQAIGRLLSESRNATSRLSTWNKLNWHGNPAASSAIGMLLRQLTHSAARRPPRKTIGWCLARVDAAQAALPHPESENHAGIIPARLEKLHRRAIKRCHKLARGKDEDFHEARKAVKALLGAMHHLPKGTVPPDPRLEKLADLLGDENDLAMLASWLEAHGFTKAFVPDLWKTIEKNRNQLKKKAVLKVAAMIPETPQ